MSLNICGISTLKKRRWVKELYNKNLVNFLGLQETRMIRVDLFKIQSMLGNSSFNFACSIATGNSGSILSVWDPNVLKKERVLCTENVVLVNVGLERTLNAR